MDITQQNADAIQFISSPSELAAENDLLTVHYLRVQKASPEFSTVYEGIDQSIDINISTLVFCTAPEPVLALYDFIMTTFVGDGGTQPSDVTATATIESDGQRITTESKAEGKIRVLLKLKSVQGILLRNKLWTLMADSSYK